MSLLTRRRHRWVIGSALPEVASGQHSADGFILDFQFDSAWHGRMIKVRYIVHEYTSEHIPYCGEQEHRSRLRAESLDVGALELAGYQPVIRMDNGPERMAHALEDWRVEDETIQALIPLDQPCFNGVVKSFHNRSQTRCWRAPRSKI